MYRNQFDYDNATPPDDDEVTQADLDYWKEQEDEARIAAWESRYDAFE